MCFEEKYRKSHSSTEISPASSSMCAGNVKHELHYQTMEMQLTMELEGDVLQCPAPGALREVGGQC